jgi:hypothetical protein
MAFPSSPTNGQTATVGGITYNYNSTKTAWVRIPSAGANISVFTTTITSTISSTSTATGALRVDGGAGIAGNVFTGGIVDITSTAASTSTSTGALIVDGGAGIAGNVWTGGIVDITSTAASTSTSTGALIVDGGAGIAGNLFASTITLTGGAGGAQLNLRNGGDLVCFNSDNSGSISVYCDNNNQLIVNGSLRATATVGFTSEFDNGNSGSSYTINFNNGQKQRITLTAAPCTLSFTAPTVGVGNFLIKIVQDGGGSKTITWPATVKWPNGTAPTLSTAAGAIDIVSLYYDGTNYYSVASLNFS